MLTDPEWGQRPGSTETGVEWWYPDEVLEAVGTWTIPWLPVLPSSSQTSPLQEASSVTSPNSMDCGDRQA